MEEKQQVKLTREQKLVNLGYMIKLMAAAINEITPPEPPEDVNYDYIYRSCKFHDIANTVFYAVEKLKNKPYDALYKKWKDERNMGVHRYMVQTMEADALRKAFNDNEIDFMPVKGFPVCELYPEPNYRYMGDLDYLLRYDDLKKAGVIVKNMGYMPEMVGKYHHDEYKKPPLMAIELHHSMVSITSKFYDYYEGFLDKAENVGGYEYKMSDEDFYVFQLVHLNKHFEEAGSGVRSFADMYLLNKKKLPTLDKEYINAELEKLGLTEFAKFVDEINDKWFVRGDTDNLSEDEIYIATSGAYGLDYHKYKNRQIGKTKAQLIRERLFPSVKRMKETYPILRKSMVFLPATYVHRFFRGVFTKSGNIKTEIKTMKK